MREIKYQAWYNGKMYAVNQIIWYSETNIVYGLTDQAMPGSQIWVGTHEAEVREYTGLKDCKGKDIYEGDIVTCEGFGGRYKIEYEGCSFIGRQTESYQWLDIEMQELEGIGNIYENPELLK